MTRLEGGLTRARGVAVGPGPVDQGSLSLASTPAPVEIQYQTKSTPDRATAGTSRVMIRLVWCVVACDNGDLTGESSRPYTRLHTRTRS